MSFVLRAAAFKALSPITIGCNDHTNRLQVQNAQPAPYPTGVSASAAKAPSSGAPLSVGECHKLLGGTGSSEEQPAALPQPDPQPCDLHSGLPCTVRGLMPLQGVCRRRSFYSIGLCPFSVCSGFCPVCQILRSWTESPSCQKTPCPSDYPAPIPPGCVAFYDTLPWSGAYGLTFCCPLQQSATRFETRQRFPKFC